MRIVRNIFCGLLALALLGICGDSAQAQEGRWGIGGFVDYNIPIAQLRDRWDNTAKYGGTLNYVASQSATIEIEYHYSKFDNGKPATQLFTYIDGNQYRSPNAKSEMTFNSLVVNGLLFLGEENSTHGFKAKDYRYYLLVGGGLYRYKAVNENLVYPRQTTNLLDLDLVMDTQIDQRYTLGGNFGFGVEGFVTDNLAVDLRGRYTFVVGELRPLLYYDLERTRPLHTLDVGASLKFYFWR